MSTALGGLTVFIWVNLKTKNKHFQRHVQAD